MHTVHHIYISSEDREDYANTNPAKCRISLPKNFKPQCMELAFAQIPNTYYNINSTNDSFLLNGSPITVPSVVGQRALFLFSFAEQLHGRRFYLQTHYRILT